MLHFLRRLDLLLGGCRVKMGFRLGTLSRGTLSPSVGAPPTPLLLGGGDITHCLGVSSAIWSGVEGGRKKSPPPSSSPSLFRPGYKPRRESPELSRPQPDLQQPSPWDSSRLPSPDHLCLWSCRCEWPGTQERSGAGDPRLSGGETEARMGETGTEWREAGLKGGQPTWEGERRGSPHCQHSLLPPSTLLGNTGGGRQGLCPSDR